MAKCKQKTEVWSRVCGYYRPVNTTWNRGKKEEFKDRTPYALPENNVKKSEKAIDKQK